MICFELKASKSDLQKELKDGTKSNAIGQFTDYFFLVCPDGIIDDSNFVEDMAAFLHLRKDFSQDAMFTMNSISHHTKRLEESMIKMKQIFSLPEE